MEYQSCGQSSAEGSPVKESFPPVAYPYLYSSPTEFPDDEWFQSLFSYILNKGILTASEDKQLYLYNPLEFDPRGLEEDLEFAPMSKRVVIGEMYLLMGKLLQGFCSHFPHFGPGIPTWNQLIQRVYARRMEGAVRSFWREAATIQRLFDDCFEPRSY